MAKVITFGELMLRLQPYNYERFVQCDHVEFTFGGGEANVAVSLANYGMDVAYVTKLPTHAIGQAAVNSLRRYGVDTSLITRGGERVGIYFNEKGASQRGSVCIYDRKYSAIQQATTADFDWEKIFDGAEWFHFTGITPALGANVVEICREACKAAKAKGIKISCDLNYRGKLWTRAQAREAMTKLAQYIDVCISNEEDAKDVFGIEAALIAKNRAPGLNRRFAAEEFPWMPKTIWDEVKTEAKDKEFNGKYQIVGSDSDPACVSLSFANARKAGVSDCVTFKDGDATKMPLPTDSGILVCNPPYGERMMEQQSAQRLYSALGRHLKFANNWKKFVITSEPEFEHYFGKRADKKRKFYNGKIQCNYYMFTDSQRRK